MPFSERFNPPLTTIRIPHYEIGASAAELLLERLQRARTMPARHVVLTPQLVVRDSSGGPATHRSVLTSRRGRAIGCTRLLQSFAH